MDDPLRELQLLTGELLAWKDLLRTRIGELTTIGYRGMTSEQVRAEVQLYRDAVTQLGSLLTSIAKLRIDERLCEIEHTKAVALAAAVEAAVAEVGLPAADARRARLAVVRHLRAVEDGEAA
ncbi:hypothetical protein H4696_008460 [Amycolatopsis lexingtonensis]|uniref:Transcriptional regulator n=1 Tax=Amycolatopsis lexingtonensis TaxID=218822 RepID=A0ABR9IDU5_9PSEU|nr:hypothetical protein [Amycolatopsis lexingtonensis]MBE1501360.1 hypothetical protein [Amycolatopsis lexingtonensis]